MFGWPVVCVVLFTRLRADQAAIWSLLGAYLLLPSGWDFDVPGLPPFDKMAVAGITTLVLCVIWGEGKRQEPNSRLLMILSIGFVIAPVATSFNNSNDIFVAGREIHGFTLADGLKAAGRNMLMLIPLYVGRRYLATDQARAYLLKALPSATLFYSLLMLFEVRMSPQLHRWVYGYFPHESFAQQIRAGGFRPVVFFQHGLALALFTSLAFLAAIILARRGAHILRFPASAVGVYLGGVLILCKSLGPVIYAVIFAPLVILFRPHSWVKIGCIVSLALCAYPLLRSLEIAPTQLVGELARSVSEDRSKSFQIRVDNEGKLLTRANEKPWFGWGGWGRNRLYDKWTGQDISVSDGGWIIYFGVYGWFGYLSLFGLIAVAMIEARGAIGRDSTSTNIVRGGLALILTAYLTDAIPNGMQEPIVFLLAGCITGPSRKPRVARRSTEPVRKLKNSRLTVTATAARSEAGKEYSSGPTR